MSKHHEKIKLTVECSRNERMYIKMLAAKKHITISELLLTSVRKLMPPTKDTIPTAKNTPNAETRKALNESREGKLKSYKTMEDFWKAMGIDPHA